ncbi:uncharacterized protein MELLADRAFT_60528 [Melampsora larici-populina 98AG31]|uniref:Uncharacterized protein n=1 Tax=Melampsora larici-populina (strain 98AG31 / pathotype 3-4-7) TaxID=747676 RepID=F4RBI7_MELLP|nr:uncharacterized protein MELLADRAFT_60528 [Melampsora larici-populina 98AG31]EGG10354.1 hypothetical protein MELLADRAFT_60528 [Melampsora larici-populina 98AG31]
MPLPTVQTEDYIRIACLESWIADSVDRRQHQLKNREESVSANSTHQRSFEVLNSVILSPKSKPSLSAFFVPIAFVSDQIKHNQPQSVFPINIMSPLNEAFLNFQSEFRNLSEPEANCLQEAGDAPLSNVLAESRVQFKPVVSENRHIQVNRTRIRLKPCTPMDSFAVAETVYDARSQLKAVAFEASGADLHKNYISIKILDSIEDLRDHATLPPSDAFGSADVPNILDRQINVQNSNVTATHLRDLAVLLKRVYDSLRHLDGRGATEIRVLMEEFSWYKNFEAVDNTDQFIKSMFDHQHETFIHLSNLAQSTIDLIQKTHLTNEMDTISSRWTISNKPKQGTSIQWILALHALHTELLHRHNIPSMTRSKPIPEITEDFTADA